MLADIAIGNVEREFENWSEIGHITSLESWNDVQAELEKAKRLNRNEADYYQLQAVLHEWRYFASEQPYSSTELTASRQRAIDAYRTSTTLRPAWPEGWANLALQKAFQGQIDEELDLAIARATALGAWDPRVQILVAEAGSMTWPYLNEASQTAIINNLQRAFSVDRTVIQFLSRLETNKLFLVTFCPLLNQASLTIRAQTACKPAI